MAKRKPFMDEAKAKEIANSRDLSQYSYEELAKADAWVKNYALAKLQLRLTEQGAKKELRNYVALMARSTFGSIETDELLVSMNCYPTWLGEKL